MKEEIWKDVEGYKGLYMVSNMGRVKSLNYGRTGKERVLKPVKLKTGYLRVILCKNNKKKRFYIHRLVSTAFIPNPDNKPQIDHINTVRTDNRVENLRWCTAKENNSNPISRKRLLYNSPVVGKFGKDNCNSKQVYQYSLDNKFIREWDCVMNIKRELGFSQGNIYDCCRGERKIAYGYRWKYAE